MCVRCKRSGFFPTTTRRMWTVFTGLAGADPMPSGGVAGLVSWSVWAYLSVFSDAERTTSRRPYLSSVKSRSRVRWGPFGSPMSIALRNLAQLCGIRPQCAKKSEDIWKVAWGPRETILLGDLNAHSTVFGADSDNDAGAALELVTAELGLRLLNGKDARTYFYVPCGAKDVGWSCPDLGFATPLVANSVSRWKVAAGVGGCSHLPATFDMGLLRFGTLLVSAAGELHRPRSNALGSCARPL